MLKELLEQILLEESVSVDKVSDAIDKHEQIIITYHTNGEDFADGARVIEVYAYGLTKAGNPVIRAFQPYGDTTSKVPSWKFFRLDRISYWEATGRYFNHPASDDYKGLGEFNKYGDKTMSIVYKIANFDNAQSTNPEDSGVKTKEDVYQTDAERDAKAKLNNLQRQLDNPITLDQLKTATAFGKQKPSETPPSGPRMKEKPEPELFKTDTEKAMERLRQQLNNPTKIDLSKFEQPKQQEEEPQPQQEEKPEPEVFKTDTEKAMERLRQQLNNPTKIDLSKIPRK